MVVATKHDRAGGKKRCLPPELVRPLRDRCVTLLVAAICGSVLPGSTAAGEQTHQLRGLFRNTEG